MRSRLAALKLRLRRLVPTPEALRASRSLRWLGPLMDRPALWRFTRRGVATGIAIGVFFGLLVPVLQIAFAAAVSVLLRANLPVAAAATLVSNPLTYAPIAVAAYHVGSALLGDPALAAEAALLEHRAEEPAPLAVDWWQQLLSVGKPVLLGLVVFAVGGAALAYTATHLVWYCFERLRLRRRDQPRP